MIFFFFNDTATTEIYTLSLHDALPICIAPKPAPRVQGFKAPLAADFAHPACVPPAARRRDRKSTRLNSSHANISYAVFCLKKKNKTQNSFLLLISTDNSH